MLQLTTIYLLVGYTLAISALHNEIARAAQGNLASQNVSSYRIEDDRLQIPRIDSELKLAEPNKIKLSLQGHIVQSAFATWSYYDREGFIHPFSTPADPLTVMYGSDGQAYVNVTPLRLGRLELRLMLDFEDDVSASKRIDLRVRMPDRKADRLVVSTGLPYDRMQPFLYLDLQSRQRGLFPAAVYKGISEPVPVDAQYVTFRVISAPETEPPIELDGPTGRVTPLHLGHALVQTKFQNLSTFTCVDVVKDARFPSGADCHELLPPGKSLPPEFTDTRGPKPVTPRPKQ